MKLIVFGCEAKKAAKILGVKASEMEVIEASRVTLSEPQDRGDCVELTLAVEIGEYEGMKHSARAHVKLEKTELLQKYLSDMAKVPPPGSASRPGWYPLEPTKAAFLAEDTTEVDVNGARRYSTPIVKMVFNNELKRTSLARTSEVLELEL